MLVPRIQLKRCTAAVLGEGEPPAAESMPPAKRLRERVIPSRFMDSVVPSPMKKGCRAGAAGVEVGEDGKVYDVEVRVVAPRGTAFGAVETMVWTGEDPLAQTEEELYRACQNISRSSSSGGVSGSVVTSVGNAGGNGGLEGRPVVVECKPKREGSEKREGFYRPKDFVLGDVVWARSGKKCPAWPALVIDPLLHAPEIVLNSCIPGALCVMFFGYSAGGHGRDYGWVKQGMIFPFVDYLDRFQDNLCISSSQENSVQQLRRLSLLSVAFFELQMDGGAHWRSLSMTSLSLMAYRRGLVRIMSKSVNLRLRSQRGRSKMENSYFVGIVR